MVDLFGNPEPATLDTPDVTGRSVYRVLARKYRPSTFSELIGQNALVQTLTQAISQGRLAQAWMLTGVRGIGKTTTARIIARALNCVGADGQGGPTTNPCGVCENCVAIAADRHVDVLEMDAASRTGIDDIREIIDGVKYNPVKARYKIYIIDEVHMLSNNAFNALLKTLEEPPPHTKFIFATTEIRKVPITVLSRCQRFDLRRIPTNQLAEHYAKVSALEQVEADPEALQLIARAADGSVRDGLSLLDQAMATATDKITATLVKEMLGLADRAAVLELADAIWQGQTQSLLNLFDAQIAAGADPLELLQDLAEVLHLLGRQHLQGATLSAGLADFEQAYLSKWQQLSVPALTRAWQILQKGILEVQQAERPAQAALMVLLRLVYAANLPLPGELIRQLQNQSAAVITSGQNHESGNGRSSHGEHGSPASQLLVNAGAGRGAAAIARPQLRAVPVAAAAHPQPQSFKEILALLEQEREGRLYAHLFHDVHFVNMTGSRIELRLGARAPRDLPQQLGQFLQKVTQQQWLIGLSSEAGEPTLAEQAAAASAALWAGAKANPLVAAALAHFPGATLASIQPRANAAVAQNPDIAYAGAQADDETME